MAEILIFQEKVPQKPVYLDWKSFYSGGKTGMIPECAVQETDGHMTINKDYIAIKMWRFGKDLSISHKKRFKNPVFTSFDGKNVDL